MKQNSSSGANCCSASQVILRLLWQPEVYYRVRKIPLPIPILNYINPNQTFLTLREINSK
jgi:hypothetical protein